MLASQHQALNKKEGVIRVLQDLQQCIIEDCLSSDTCPQISPTSQTYALLWSVPYPVSQLLSE